jgi:hypothetical protein
MIIQRKRAFLFSLILFFGSYRGYLAVFEKDAQEPRQIFPCRVETLPLADQIKLKNRIRIRNQQELEQILEDYLS